MDIENETIQGAIPWWLPLLLDTGTLIMSVEFFMMWQQRKAALKTDAPSERDIPRRGNK